MVLPKHIKISGKKFKVITDPKSNGGSFDVEKMTITIGTESPGRVPGIFMHEVLELICEESDVRYFLFKDCVENEGLKFILNHKEFDSVTQILTGVMLDVAFTDVVEGDSEGFKKLEKKKKPRKSKDVKIKKLKLDVPSVYEKKTKAEIPPAPDYNPENDTPTGGNIN